MRRFFAISSRVVLGAMLVISSFAGKVLASDEAAIVTYVEGRVQAYGAGAKDGALLKRNDRVVKNQRITTGEKSRLELRFPDGTIMRFAERSTIKMEDLTFDTKSKNKRFRVDMGVGKMWASVKKLFTAESRIEVKTVNAVAGVRGTVYRVNVNEDNSALIKVYDGSVSVDGVQRTSPAASPPGGFSAPVPVPGPHAVPPPYHEVSMEEWHVIVRSFQQITISPQGMASAPLEFNPKQDMDDWVKWNMERDNQFNK